MQSECRFLGAAGDIGRLGMVLEAEGKQFLFDYGIAPDKPPKYPLEAPSVDQVFLTHAHLDHTGMIPWLATRMDSEITTTPPTAEVSKIMHNDALKVARSEGYPEPYNEDAIEATGERYRPMDFERERHFNGLTARLHSAGHIPGAAQVELEGESGTTVFTGDLYTRKQRLVGPGEPVDCDVLFMETTYAGREHPERSGTEADFLEYVDEVTGRGGTVVAAAFALGRAQELMLVLAQQGYEVWMDGMARRISELFLQHPEYLTDAAAYKRALKETKMIWNHRGRHVALEQADVILTTSGMLEGGPILFYLDKLRNDPQSGVALTGYQVRGTNGRRLMDDGELDFDTRDPGKKVHSIECDIQHFDFSAHAGHSDLVGFARDTGADDIVLFHGDNREALEADLSDFATVHMPDVGETFRLPA